MFSSNEVSVYELAADETTLWVSPNAQFGFDIEIDAWDGTPLMREKGMHPAAMESLASFCRSFLASYAHAQRKVAA